MSLNCSLENPRRGNVFDVGFRIVGFCYGSFAFGNENHKTYTTGHLNPRGCLIGHPFKWCESEKPLLCMLVVLMIN